MDREHQETNAKADMQEKFQEAAKEFLSIHDKFVTLRDMLETEIERIFRIYEEVQGSKHELKQWTINEDKDYMYVFVHLNGLLTRYKGFRKHLLGASTESLFEYFELEKQQWREAFVTLQRLHDKMGKQHEP